MSGTIDNVPSESSTDTNTTDTEESEDKTSNDDISFTMVVFLLITLSFIMLFIASAIIAALYFSFIFNKTIFVIVLAVTVVIGLPILLLLCFIICLMNLYICCGEWCEKLPEGDEESTKVNINSLTNPIEVDTDSDGENVYCDRYGHTHLVSDDKLGGTHYFRGVHYSDYSSDSD